MLLSDFKPVTCDEVERLLSKTIANFFSLDVIPTCLLKRLFATISHSIFKLDNISLSTGIFPKQCKSALVTPILKKRSLPITEPSSYRPISNLPTVSKLAERLVLTRLLSHISSSPNLYPQQSAYVKRRSTETSLLHLIDSLHLHIAGGSPALFISLDISAAFDSIDHEILLRRLEDDFGLTGVVLG